MLCHAFDLGSAEGKEAVHEGDAGVDFGGLAVGAPVTSVHRTGYLHN